MERFGGGGAEQLPVGVNKEMISVEFCSAEAFLLGRRQRRWLVVEFGRVNTLQANCDLPVLDRRLSGSADDHCLLSNTWVGRNDEELSFRNLMALAPTLIMTFVVSASDRPAGQN